MSKPLFTLKNNSIFVIAEAAGGVYNSTQLKKITDICEEESAFLKITEDQRIGFMMSSEKVSDIQQSLSSVGLLLRHYQAQNFGAPKTCLGEICEHSKQDALGTGFDITPLLSEKLKSYEEPLSIGINGCARACVPSATSDIHLIGEEGGYKIYIGGSHAPEPHLASLIGEGIPNDKVGEVIAALLDGFMQHAQPGESFFQVTQRVGLGPFLSVCGAEEELDPVEASESLPELDVPASPEVSESSLELEETAPVEVSESSLESDAPASAEVSESSLESDAPASAEVSESSLESDAQASAEVSESSLELDAPASVEVSESLPDLDALVSDSVEPSEELSFKLPAMGPPRELFEQAQQESRALPDAEKTVENEAEKPDENDAFLQNEALLENEDEFLNQFEDDVVVPMKQSAKKHKVSLKMLDLAVHITLPSGLDLQIPTDSLFEGDSFEMEIENDVLFIEKFCGRVHVKYGVIEMTLPLVSPIPGAA